MKFFLYITLFVFSFSSLKATDFMKKDSVQKGHFSGSFQADYQKYLNDGSFIYEGLEKKYGVNSYINLQYQYGKFRAGVRYEGYFPPLISYPQNLDGQGFVNRFVNYQSKHFFINLGNFYEQFGSGMMLRATEQRSLGMDTSIDGVSVKVNPTKHSQIKVLAGKQRLGFTHANGILYGVDIWNELPIHSKNLSLGISAVNKRENYEGILKEIKPSVWVYGGRMNFQKNNFGFNAEFAQKTTDASRINQYSTKKGSGIFITSNLDFENISLAINLKRIENMDFRSQRTESLNNALINYIPATTKQHSYRLLTLYPYASQVLGEIGGQFDLIYTLPQGDVFSLNVANLNGIKNSNFIIGNKVFYQDLNAEYEKQWSKKFKTNLMLVYLNFNKGQILGGKPEMVKSFTVILDATHKLQRNKALRYEIQHLATKQDFGNWFFGLIELSVSPYYFFFVSNEINYQNFNFEKVRHFPNIGSAFSYKSHRISLSYGKQREGLLCVGGICRLTPAYTGFSGGITSSF